MSPNVHLRYSQFITNLLSAESILVSSGGKSECRVPAAEIDADFV